MNRKKTTFLQRLGKAYIPFAIVSVVGIIATVSLYLYFAPKEAREIDPRPFTASFPLCYDASKMPKPPQGKQPYKWSTWSAYAKRAAQGLNKQTGKTFWIDGRQGWITGNPGCNKSNTFHIVPAKAKEKEFPQGRCQPIPWKPKASTLLVFEKTLGWIDFEARKIVLCVEKIAQAYSMAYVDNPVARKIRNSGGNYGDGRVTILRHEMAHAIIRPHLKWGCGLMCAAPNTGQFSKYELQIINQKVIPRSKFRK